MELDQEALLRDIGKRQCFTIVSFFDSLFFDVQISEDFSNLLFHFNQIKNVETELSTSQRWTTTGWISRTHQQAHRGEGRRNQDEKQRWHYVRTSES